MVVTFGIIINFNFIIIYFINNIISSFQLTITYLLNN
jgi:hypothetical protein